MREMTVPKSFEVQRTNEKMLSGANDRIRRRLSRICSSAAWPKHIQFSLRFSSQRSSTWVRSLMPSPFCGGRLSSLNAFQLRRVRRLTAGVPVEERSGYDAERERLSVIPRGEKRVVR